MKKTLLLCMLLSRFVLAQNSQAQLANQYYYSGEYQKAIAIYEELINGETISMYFAPYFDCLLLTENYKDAELLAAKMVKKYPSGLNFLVDYGFALQQNKKQKKAEEIYQKAIDNLNNQTGQAIMLANAFVQRKELAWALRTYEKAKPLNPNYPFDMQIAALYSQMGEVENMIVSYLELVANHPEQIQSVKNNLQIFLNNDGIESDKNYQLLKRNLLKYAQQENGVSYFSDMLIWLFMQSNQFEQALLQAKALDKRAKENGERIFQLTEIFLDNAYYDLAINAYDYIIAKGLENPYYRIAMINRLYANSKSIEKNKSTIALKEIDQHYQQAIAELGKNYSTILLLSNYAHFKAFYLNDLGSAAKILEEAMLIPQLNEIDLAECKLEYADILLLSNEIWQATLFYSQVEKDFKDDPLGHDAKLRIAKISYYQGDFDWAQAQLDVLKASTSKLIANDAMQLALLITDNLGLDTSVIPMQMFARADMLYFQQNFEPCVQTLDSILLQFPGHTLSDEILFRKANIAIKNNNVEKAVALLEQLIQEYHYDILADDAIFTLADLYQNQLKNKEKAVPLYERILLEYQGSIFTAEARKRFRMLTAEKLGEKQSL